MWVEGPAPVTHDFGGAPLCQVPLALHVRNCARGASLAFAFEALETGRIGKCGYTLIGTTKVAEEWLPPDGHVRLPLHAVVRDAGTFLVDALRVTLVAWKRGEKDDEQRPAAPILCPPPAGRVVKVVRK